MLAGNLALGITWPKQPFDIASTQVPRREEIIIEQIVKILKAAQTQKVLSSWAGPLEFPQSGDWVVDLPGEKFILVRYIPVTYEQGEGGEWIASFQEANIHVSGENIVDASETLRSYINRTFEILLREEKNLAPVAEKQLSVLKSYIRTS